MDEAGAEDTEYRRARRAVSNLLGDGEWRSRSVIWRTTGLELKWVALVLRAMRERDEVELRPAVSAAGVPDNEYRLVK
jgi:hypothetical protein